MIKIFKGNIFTNNVESALNYIYKNDKEAMYLPIYTNIPINSPLIESINEFRASNLDSDDIEESKKLYSTNYTNYIEDTFECILKEFNSTTIHIDIQNESVILIISTYENNNVSDYYKGRMIEKFYNVLNTFSDELDIYVIECCKYTNHTYDVLGSVCEMEIYDPCKDIQLVTTAPITYKAIYAFESGLLKVIKFKDGRSLEDIKNFLPILGNEILQSGEFDSSEVLKTISILDEDDNIIEMMEIELDNEDEEIVEMTKEEQDDILNRSIPMPLYPDDDDDDDLGLTDEEKHAILNRLTPMMDTEDELVSEEENEAFLNETLPDINSGLTEED